MIPCSCRGELPGRRRSDRRALLLSNVDSRTRIGAGGQVFITASGQVRVAEVPDAKIEKPPDVL